MCLRCIVCLPSTLAFVVGVLVIVVPTWVSMGGSVNFNALDPNNHYMGYALYIYWIAGAALMILAFVMFCAASAVDSILCRTIIPLAVIIVLLVVILPTVLRTDDLHDNADKAVKNLQQKYGMAAWAKHTIDSMQQVFRCCGSDDPSNQSWRSWLQYGSCIPRSCSTQSNPLLMPSLTSSSTSTDAVKNECLMTVGSFDISELVYAVRNLPNSQPRDLSSVQSSIYTTSCTAKIMIIAWITIGFVCAVLALTLVSFLGNVCCCRGSKRR